MMFNLRLKATSFHVETNDQDLFAFSSSQSATCMHVSTIVNGIASDASTSIMVHCSKIGASVLNDIVKESTCIYHGLDRVDMYND